MKNQDAQEVEPTKHECEESDCQECRQYDKRDHGICLYCGHEDDGSEAIDRAYDNMRDR